MTNDVKWNSQPIKKNYFLFLFWEIIFHLILHYVAEQIFL